MLLLCLPTGGDFFEVHPGMVFISRKISDGGYKSSTLLAETLLVSYMRCALVFLWHTRKWETLLTGKLNLSRISDVLGNVHEVLNANF